MSTPSEAIERTTDGIDTPDTETTPIMDPPVKGGRKGKAQVPARLNADWGRPHRKTSDAMKELWATAKELNRDPETGGKGFEWIPWRAIEVRLDILPRQDQVPDKDTVERYAAHFDELPPIEVQKDTLVLIDGMARLTAAPEAGFDHIKIVEKDVPDAGLRQAAFEANSRHGRPLKPEDRKAMAIDLFQQGWNDTKIADLIKAHRVTVATWRRAYEGIPKERTAPAAPSTNGTAPASATAPLDDQFDQTEDPKQSGDSPAPESHTRTDTPAPLGNKIRADDRPSVASTLPAAPTDQQVIAWYNDARAITQIDPDDLVARLNPAGDADTRDGALDIRDWWDRLIFAFNQRIEARMKAGPVAEPAADEITSEPVDDGAPAEDEQS